MKTLIIFNHPYEGSFCNAILQAVTTGLKNGGHPCKTINLDKDSFDPVMRAKDLKAFADLGRGIDSALMMKGTFNQIGIHDAKWISFNMVKQVGNDVREQWLNELEEMFARS